MNWETKRLGELVSLASGFGFPERFQGHTHGSLPFYKVSDMSSPGNDRDLDRANHYVSPGLAHQQGWTPCPSGSIAFAKVGAALLLNRRRRLIRDSLFDNNMMAAIPGDEVDSAWLYWWLQRVDFGCFAQPGVLPSVSQRQVASLAISTPPLAEQRLIARILDTVDEAIRKTEQLIAKLKLLKHGLFHDLLTRGVDENGELRDPEWYPEQFKDSPFGRIPREWSVWPLGQLVASSTLGTTSRGAERSGDDNLWLLKMGNLTWGGLELSELEAVARAKVSNWQDLLLKPGDLLLNTRNTPDLVGKTAAWRGGISGDIVTDNNILRMRFDSRADGVFLATYMGNGAGRRRISRLATGTTSVAAIYWASLCNLLVPTPCRREQAAIVNIIDRTDFRIERESASVTKLRLLKSGLMDDLLTGRVRVTPLLEKSSE